MKRELSAKTFEIVQPNRDKAFPEEPAGASEKQLARWLLGFDDVHRALGWLSERLKDGDRVE